MFTREITTTSFVNEIANDALSYIEGQSFRGDISFTSTLRALLHNRVDKDKGLRLRFTQTNYTFEDVKTYGSTRDGLQLMFGIQANLKNDRNLLLIHSLTYTDEEDNSKTLEYVREKFCSIYGDDYIRAEDLSVYFSKLKLNIDFYISKDKQNAVILADRLNLKYMHAIQSIIPRLLPWYFENSPYTEEEKNLLLSLSKKTEVEYLDLIEKFAEKFDFRAIKIRKLLPNFESVFIRRQTEEVKSKVNHCDREIEDITCRFADLLRRKEDFLLRLIGLESRLEEKSDGEVMKYFLCNNSLYLESVSGNTLTFIVDTYLDEYDPEIFERYLNNKGSVLYRQRNGNYSQEEAEILLKAMFGEEACLRIKTCAAFQIDIGTLYVYGQRGYHYPTKFSNHLPNQHIHRHSCLGGNEKEIVECLANGDFILAIEQCASSARNFNMSDGVVADEFMAEIYSSAAKKFLELPDGTMVSPREALDWLTAKSKEAEEVVEEDVKEETKTEVARDVETD